jgi:putative transposase
LVGDINYIKLRWEFVYLAVLVDVFTRCIWGWDLKRSLSQELTQLTSQKVLVQHTPGIHHSGQRVQYAATAYVQLVEESESSKKRRWTSQSTRNYWDASWQMGQFLKDAYMQKCIHSSLGYLIPVEFERQWLAQQDVPEAVH